MTCFWTDLVGATQQCATTPAGLRLRINGVAVSNDPPSSALAVANRYVADFATSEPAVLFFQASTDGTGSFAPQSAAAEYQSIAYIGSESALGAPFSVMVPATTALVSDRFESPTGEALIVAASLSVVSAAVFGEWACGASEFSLETFAAPAASVAYDSPGVLEFSMTSLGTGSYVIGSGPPGAVYSVMLRVTGTVTDENSAELAVDFWARFDYNGCF